MGANKNRNADEFGKESLLFRKIFCFQRDVQEE